jgi:hypothetical protein
MIKGKYKNAGIVPSEMDKLLDDIEIERISNMDFSNIEKSIKKTRDLFLENIEQFRVK